LYFVLFKENNQNQTDVVVLARASEAQAVLAPPSSGRGRGSSSFAFKDTCTKTACLSFHSKMHLQHGIINHLWGILSLKFTDTFCGHLRLAVKPKMYSDQFNTVYSL